MEETVIGQVFVRLQPHHFEAEEIVYRYREVGDAMYFIEKGQVEVGASFVVLGASFVAVMTCPASRRVIHEEIKKAAAFVF